MTFDTGLALRNDTMPLKQKVAQEETYPVIGFLCLMGIFLHLFINEPIMLMAGIHYTADDNGILEKQHLGTYFIILSFLMLILRHGNPFGMLAQLYRSERVFTGFFLLYLLILTYMVMRSGAKGLSFIIDTQVDAILAALVLSKTPVSYCRRTLYAFIAFAFVNSAIGIGEGIMKDRIFTFDPDSSVIQDRIFRASAWLGHPLNNAMFTGVMLFIVLGSRLSAFAKTVICTMLSVSLIAFGGRSGLIVSCAGLGILGAVRLLRSWTNRGMSLLQVLLLMTAVTVIPAGFCFSLYGLINSEMGERLSSEGSFDDKSAEARVLAWRVFDYIKPEEFIFGMEPARTTEIRDEMSQSMNLFLIENPWILMFMHLGLIVFSVWFVAMMALALRLMYRNPLPIKLAVIAYYIIASTNNSFAVKGSIHLIILSAIICASRSLMIKEEPTAYPSAASVAH